MIKIIKEDNYHCNLALYLIFMMKKLNLKRDIVKNLAVSRSYDFLLLLFFFNRSFNKLLSAKAIRKRGSHIWTLALLSIVLNSLPHFLLIDYCNLTLRNFVFINNLFQFGSPIHLVVLIENSRLKILILKSSFINKILQSDSLR